MEQNSSEYRKPIEYSGYVFFPEKNDFNEFDLLVKFLSTSESPIPNVFDFALSIRNKYVAVVLSYNEVLNQITRWNKELEEIKSAGFSLGIQGILLAIKYEIYLNSIYSLCENLSFLITKFYQQGLSPRFNKQKEQFLNDKKSIDQVYSEILKETEWYNEVHSIRSEATHFLSGIVFISDSNEPSYLTRETYNQRKCAPKNINVESVKAQIENIQNNLEIFLDRYSKHFKEMKFNKYTPISELCIRTEEGKLGYRSITLDDYLNGRPRKCISIEFNCPHQGQCKFDYIN
jgi:hypothetical protein